MNNNVKKFITPGFYIVAGFFNLIWLALNHFTAFARYGGDGIRLKISSGYKFIGEKYYRENLDGEFLRIFTTLALIGIFVASIVLIAVGAFKLLKTLGVDSSFLEGEVVDKVITTASSLVLLLNMIFCIVDFAVLGLYGIINTESLMGITSGCRAGVGCWFLLLWGIGAFVASKTVINKLPVEEVETVRVNYVCSQCGAKAKKSEKFCAACGGAVKAVAEPKFACSVCGKKAKSTEKFCTACGGAITEVVEKVCPACGKPVSDGIKFCTACGAALEVAEEAAAETNENA